MLRYRLFFLRLILAALVLLAVPAFAQLPSAASLNGDYFVRYVAVNTVSDATLSWGGTMKFDGKGGFTLSGAGASSAVTNKTLTPLTSGSYDVLPNGMLYIANPFDTATAITANNHIYLYGGLGAGVIVASSTEDIFTDLFIAIPASTGNSAAKLSGTYQVASLEFLGGDFGQTRNTFFTMNADGAGGLGNVTIKGTAQSFSGAAQAQTSSAATYTVTGNGSGTLVLPAPSGLAAGSVLLSGNKVLFSNADGSMFIAGATTGYDLVVGIKQSSPANFNGLYFTGYLENYAVGDPNNDGPYSSSGSSNVLNALKQEIAHTRVNSELFYPYDYTFSNPYSFSADGTSPNSNFAVGANGNVLLGAGGGSDYQLAIYVKSVAITPTGSVFLNPQGIVNAANNVPFTSQFSPGEVVTLYGSGFTTQTLTTPGLPFPNTLGGASVTVSYSDANGNPATAPAPIYFVSPGQISAVIPYTVPNDGRFLTFKVTSGGTDSNSVPVYSGPASPGIFTVPTGGIGSGAILHADFSLVSSSSTAKSGETVQIFLTGLGALKTTVTAGAAASGLTDTVAPISVVLWDSSGKAYTTGKVIYKGLAPGLGGLYQINYTLPTGLPAGTMSLEVYVGDGSDYGDGRNIQASIPIG